MKKFLTALALLLCGTAWSQTTMQVWGGIACSGTGAGGAIVIPGDYPEDISLTDLGTTGGGACLLPSATPNTWFVRVTGDKGTTWTWATLASVGQGVAPDAAPPVTTVPSNVTATVVMTWAAPTVNTDKSSLADLASFNIYRGTSAGNLAKIVTLPASSLQYSDTVGVGTWFYTITAVNSTGQESTQMTPSSANIQAPVVTPPVPATPKTPATPGNFKLTFTITVPQQ